MKTLSKDDVYDGESNASVTVSQKLLLKEERDMGHLICSGGGLSWIHGEGTHRNMIEADGTLLVIAA